MMRSSAWFRGFYLTVAALLAVLLACHFFAQQSCDASLGCDTVQSAPPASASQGLLPRKLLLQAKSVLGCRTGSDSFAAMGTAVADLISMFEYQHSASATTLSDTDVNQLLHSLRAGVSHLFPFLKSRYHNVMTDLQHHDNHTRGLVIPCGSSGFHFALHLVAAVRHVFNSTLPIEIMYAGDEDLQAPQRSALEAVGPNITSVNLLHFYNESAAGLKGGGWAIKPFAILASSFEQVIIADSDIVFLQNPEVAFDHPGYTNTGTLFFHDRVVGGTHDVHDWWQGIMGDRKPSLMLQQSRFWAGDTVHEMESGVVSFNKSRWNVLVGLLYVAWMNTKVIREEATYKLTLGDKESYWMALELAGIPYHFDNAYASAIGHLSMALPTNKLLLCPSHLLHLDHHGRPLWYNGSLYRSKREAKQDRRWMDPVVWAVDTGNWDGNACMVNIEEHGGAKFLSDGGYQKVYQATKEIAAQWDAKYDALIV